MDGCKDADPKHIPEYVEDRGRRRRPFAAPRHSRRSFQTGSKEIFSRRFKPLCHWMLKPGKHAVMVALIVYANDLHFRLDGVHFSCLLNFSESLFEKFDAGSLAWQMDGCRDADPKHIPEYIEDSGRRRLPLAAPRRCRWSFQTGA